MPLFRKRDWSEFSENLRVSFESIILADSIGSGEIDVIVSIIQADGSAKSVIFNAVSLALMDAGNNLIFASIFKDDMKANIYSYFFLNRDSNERLYSLLYSRKSS